MPCAHPIVYDALIVGSGASGSWVAKQLTEQGMRVLMLEAGPPRLPTCDFTEHVRPYQIKYRGFGNRQALIERQPIQRRCNACDEVRKRVGIFVIVDEELVAELIAGVAEPLDGLALDQSPADAKPAVVELVREGGLVDV